jgi:hypothetical protein
VARKYNAIICVSKNQLNVSKFVPKLLAVSYFVEIKMKTADKMLKTSFLLKIKREITPAIKLILA